MTFTFSKKIIGLSAVFAMSLAGTSTAQDNPLLKQNESNPLLQQNEPTAESIFEAKARAIDIAATKEASDPVCQNIRANYDQELAKIVKKSEAPEGMSISQINKYSYDGRGTLRRVNRINRNLGGSYNSGALGEVSNKIGRGASVVNDAAAIGDMLGIGGKKMSQKKAAKKVAKLDAQALDAVEQTGCPMATFN
jgi:hypothetical protein